MKERKSEEPEKKREEREREREYIYTYAHHVCMYGCMYIHICTYGCHVYVYSVIRIDIYYLREKYIYIYVCTAYCSLLELTKCVIEPSTRPRVTCNSETIACHCLPGFMYLHVQFLFSNENEETGEKVEREREKDKEEKGKIKESQWKHFISPNVMFLQNKSLCRTMYQSIQGFSRTSFDLFRHQ